MVFNHIQQNILFYMFQAIQPFQILSYIKRQTTAKDFSHYSCGKSQRSLFDAYFPKIIGLEYLIINRSLLHIVNVFGLVLKKKTIVI